MWLGLMGLATSAFTSATLLPGSSEAALLVFMAAWPESLFVGVLVATLANTLGSMTSWYIGRLAPTPKTSSRALAYLQRFGSIMLILAWVPIVGDALPLAAGWLRLPWMACLFWLSVGKALRYIAVVALGYALFA